MNSTGGINDAFSSYFSVFLGIGGKVPICLFAYKSDYLLRYTVEM